MVIRNQIKICQSFLSAKTTRQDNFDVMWEYVTSPRVANTPHVHWVPSDEENGIRWK